MLVKYSIENTGPKGLGVVAQEDIPKGTLVWSRDNAKYTAFSNEKEFIDYLEKQSIEEQKKILMYAYAFQNIVWLLHDDSHYVNHSADDFNMAALNPEEDRLYATRDIKKGEEIVEDYGKFQQIPWLEKVTQERGETSCLKLLENLNDPRFSHK